MGCLLWRFWIELTSFYGISPYQQVLCVSEFECNDNNDKKTLYQEGSEEHLWRYGLSDHISELFVSWDSLTNRY